MSNIVDDILRVEYERLKEEQIRRIGFRDNLIYVSLAVSGAIFAYYFGGHNRAYSLLMVPFAVSVLGWTYLVNDEKISAIGKYFREDLRAELVVRGCAETSTLAWETFHRSDPDRVWRKRAQTAVDLFTFCAPSVAALVVFLTDDHRGILPWVFSSVALLITALLVFSFWRFADHGRG
ncbi:hypothetical protein ACIRL0_34845 [Streptomyces sp. NPDC102365]|uniref:hypothetical protein n=1 Tax=Streptomyces sp. NPDC102365 TaxID=3366162 RepID=UPI0037F70751